MFLPVHLSLRGTLSYVWSEGSRVGIIGYGGGDRRLDDRVPLSKTPPLNGTGELVWSHPEGLSAGAAVQWATAQDRLAVADYSDGRIPKYGTPGFAVMHLRGAYRWREISCSRSSSKTSSTRPGDSTGRVSTGPSAGSWCNSRRSRLRRALTGPHESSIFKGSV